MAVRATAPETVWVWLGYDGEPFNVEVKKPARTFTEFFGFETRAHEYRLATPPKKRKAKR